MAALTPGLLLTGTPLKHKTNPPNAAAQTLAFLPFTHAPDAEAEQSMKHSSAFQTCLTKGSEDQTIERQHVRLPCCCMRLQAPGTRSGRGRRPSLSRNAAVTDTTRRVRHTCAAANDSHTKHSCSSLREGLLPAASTWRARTPPHASHHCTCQRWTPGSATIHAGPPPYTPPSAGLPPSPKAFAAQLKCTRARPLLSWRSPSGGVMRGRRRCAWCPGTRALS